MITAGFTDSPMRWTTIASAAPALRLSDIATKPTLIIHAKDDRFMDHHSIPPQEQLLVNVEYQLTEKWRTRRIRRRQRCANRKCGWEKRIPDWLTRWLGAQNDYSPARSGSRTLDNLIESFCCVKAPIMVNMNARWRIKSTSNSNSKREKPCWVWSELHETVNIMPASSFTAKAAPHIV